MMRAAALLDNDPRAAARAAEAVLNAYPGHEHAGLLLATALRRLGDSGAAAPVVESLAAGKAESPVMQLELGRSLAAAGRAEEAIGALRKSIELDPNFADAWRELAALYFANGDRRGGDAAHLTYESLAHEPFALKDARVALTEGRLGAAADMLSVHLQRQPSDAVAWRLNAEAVGRLGNAESAERSLHQSLALAPGYAAARYDLAVLLLSQERVDEALPLIDRLLEAAPQDPCFLALKVRAIRFLGRHEEARIIAEALVSAHGQDPQLWLLLGNLSREMGDSTRAVETYRRALQLRPGLGEAYWRLANLKTLRFSDGDIAEMEVQLRSGAMPGMDRTYLEFALGKAYEDGGRYAESFMHYRNGNAHRRAEMPHDSSVILADVQRSIATYTREFFAARAGWGSPQPDPVFIVGLPRSGSTLLEQILASHSQVEGTRELLYMPAIADELCAGARGSEEVGYPSCIKPLSREMIDTLAARYLSQSRAHRHSAKPRFVDKMLANFGHVGLIHLMFPNASIIDARRHPLGVGFSCFKQLFNKGMSFSYDLRDIGAQFRAYFQLMAHFDEVLPGRVHRVDYERMVAHPEQEVRRLLDYCRLPFEAECLRFYDNPRVVMTISSEQVRSPIYSSGIDQWRHYEPWLSDLKAALGNILDERP